MGAFEDALSKGAPEPEMNIFLPGRVGMMDKGGDTAQAAAPAGRSSEAQPSGSGPEPEPQLPEGSDPDEPDDFDSSEDDEADAAAAAVAAREMFKVAQPAAAEYGTVDGDPGEDLEEEIETAPEPSPMRPASSRKVGTLSFEGEHSHLKHFPKALIEVLRDLLGETLGDAPARELSQNSLVTAFVIAALGADFSADETTMAAVEAFKANDPRTLAIEQRTAALLERQVKVEGMLKAVLGRLGSVVETTAVLEMGQAYALAERTAQLDTSGVLPETLDVTQKRAVAARDNIRRRVKAQRQDETITAGRPIR